MFRAAKNEIYRIFTGKKIFMLSIVLSLISLAMSLIVETIIEKTGVLPMTVSKYSYPLHFFSNIGAIVFPILIIIMVSGLFSDDYRDGTMKQTLLGAVTRTELLSAKIIAVIISNIFILITTTVFSFIFSFIIFTDYSNFVFNNASLSLSQGLLATLSFLGILLGIGTALGIVVLTVSLLIKNSGVVVSLTMGVYLLQFFIQNFSPELRPYLISAYFQIGGTFLTTEYKNAISTLTLICGIYALVFFLISLIYINKKDIVY